MTGIDHALLGGKLHVYKREKSSAWQCSTYISAKNHRSTTKEASLSRAKEVAEDWYLTLKLKDRMGELKAPKGKPFAAVAERFMDEFEVITQGKRSPVYIQGHKTRLRVHLVPFFGKTPVPAITAGMVTEYRAHRLKASPTGKPPARSTIHQEIVCLRQVLKTANRHGWLTALPDLSAPYRGSGKVSHRA